MSRVATLVAGIPVHGVDVDDETRCVHYDSDRDVIAIRFACCHDYYPCVQCHDAVADHDPEQWARTDFDTPAVLCGRCGTELAIQTYLDAEHTCPECDGGFNPGCQKHWPAYFEV